MAKAVEAERAGQNTGLSVLIWQHFLNDGLANYLPGILPALAVDRHVPLPLIGVLMTALILGQSLQPLTGWWADRLGGRKFILGGLLLTTLGTVLVGLSHSLVMMGLWLLMTGIGNTLFHPQALTAARTLGLGREGFFMSTFLVGGELGRGLGPLAAGFLVASFGMRGIMWLAVPYVLTLPWMIKATPQMVPRKRSRTPLRWRQHLRPATALVVFSTARSVATYGVITLAPIMWHEHGGSLVGSASLVTVMVGLGVAGNLAGGMASDRIGRGRVLRLTTMGAVLFLGIFGVTNGIWEWPVLALLGMALFGSGPTTMLIGQDIFSENPALGSGIALGLANGLGALLVIPIAAIAGQWGDRDIMWLLALLLLTTLPTVAMMPSSATTRDGN